MIARRLLRPWLFLGTLSVLPGVAGAQENIQVSAEGSANIGYSNNPFSVVGDDTGSAVADIRISPQATLATERSTFVLSGSAQYQRYFRRYSNSDNYFAGLDYRGTPSDRVKTHLDLTYDNSIVGQNNSIAGVFDPTLPNVLPISGTDLSLFGARDRRQTYRADGDVSFVLSARDTLSTSAYYVRSRYDRFAQLGNYDGYGATAAYSRQISDHLQLGAQGSVAKYRYDGPQGESTIYSVRGSFSTEFSSRWKANGAVGVSFVDDDTRGTRTTLSGNLNLCRSAERSNLCVNASRSVVPTGISGTQTETLIGTNYSYRVSERGTIYANADYVRNGSDQVIVLGQNEYVRGSIGYQHTLSERVRLLVTTRYSDVFGGGANRSADYGVQAGVVIKFGNKR